MHLFQIFLIVKFHFLISHESIDKVNQPTTKFIDR